MRVIYYCIILHHAIQGVGLWNYTKIAKYRTLIISPPPLFFGKCLASWGVYWSKYGAIHRLLYSRGRSAFLIFSYFLLVIFVWIWFCLQNVFPVSDYLYNSKQFQVNITAFLTELIDLSGASMMIIL